MRDRKRSLKRRFSRAIIPSLITIAIIGALTYATYGRDIPVLSPHGTIAEQQYVLLLIVVGLGFFVIVPVFVLLFVIAWKYRASNTKAKYDPHFEDHKGFEITWWGIPILIIVALAVITWVSTHALDPYKPLESEVTPVNVQVVSLEWKWLFIYPDHNVATVNYLNIPKDTPISLSITSDAPMNAFWVPALAGQVYSMTGMSTKLHFMANKVGTFHGSSSNISGDGYADMKFKVYSLNEGDFERWARQAALSENELTSSSYAELAKPSRRLPEATYALKSDTLYTDIVMKYMNHSSYGERGEK